MIDYCSEIVYFGKSEPLHLSFLNHISIKSGLGARSVLDPKPSFYVLIEKRVRAGFNLSERFSSSWREKMSTKERELFDYK